MDEEKDLKEKKEKTSEATEKIKDKKAKGVVRRRKAKTEEPVAAALHLLVKSGKIEFGARKGIKNALGNKSKAFILSKNAPKKLRAEITKHCNTSNTPIIEFGGTSIELGSACGKPFSVSLLSVFDEGSSKILEMSRTVVREHRDLR